MTQSVSSADGTAVVLQAKYMFDDWPYHIPPGSFSLVEGLWIGDNSQKQLA